jgi:thioredoxin 1
LFLILARGLHYTADEYSLAMSKKGMGSMSKVIEVSESNFESNVLKSSKPVLVDFGADWCGPCRAIGPTIEAIAEEYEGNADIYKMNVDDSYNIANQYGIKGIPTIILFKDGKEQERIVGAVPKAAISKLIDRHR